LDLLDSLSQSAASTLRRCPTPQGLKASDRSIVHHQIWALDSMIAALGACLVDDSAIQTALLASLRILRHRRRIIRLAFDILFGARVRPQMSSRDLPN
jgi:hypothetical protein